MLYNNNNSRTKLSLSTGIGTLITGNVTHTVTFSILHSKLVKDMSQQVTDCSLIQISD